MRRLVITLAACLLLFAAYAGRPRRAVHRRCHLRRRRRPPGLSIRGGRELEGAGMYLMRSKLDLRWSDLFVNNAASAGGGIWAYSSYAGLSGVTFADNTAGRYGGASFLRGPA